MELRVLLLNLQAFQQQEAATKWHFIEDEFVRRGKKSCRRSRQKRKKFAAHFAANPRPAEKVTDVNLSAELSASWNRFPFATPARTT
jgi:hypothetical protein